MARPRANTRNLTDAYVAGLTGDVPRVYDAACPGLHVRVTPSGSKAWIVGGANGAIIGKFPAMGVAEARKIAMAKAPAALSYLSVCSGIEAASVGLEPLGFKPVAFAEIDDKARAFLREKYPNVPLRGDFTKIKKAKADILVGGPPCQDFSRIGKREIGDRGNLIFEFLELAQRIDASWALLENVPALTSADEGRFFRRFLHAANERGFSCGWRVFGLRQFGLPNLRERLFAVLYRGGPEPIADVLFRSRRHRWPYPHTSIQRGRRLDIDGGEARSFTRSVDLSRTETFTANTHIEVTPTFRHGRADAIGIIEPDGRVRLMTVLEMERSMGFPDHWTAFEYNGRPASDATRQALLGNSFAPPIINFIGAGIAEVEAVRRQAESSGRGR